MTTRKAARSTSRFRKILRDNGLSLAMGVLFLLAIVGQTVAGLATYNGEQASHHRPTLGYWSYLQSSHFAEATFENWESEFLQMAAYVLLTAILFQRGSAESNDPDQPESPKSTPRDPARRPWPVRRGGVARKLYEHSLGLAFGIIFLLSFTLHAVAGARLYSEDQRSHGEPPVSMRQYVSTSRFWFESFQNWQSEFLAILAMVVLSIFLRQQGSPESKDVESPHGETGA
jgi:Domain of unknown function (DUF6766)